MPRASCRRRAGFSLVELLVVVGISGLLLSLLLPAVQRAREAANLVVCKNNLKQIGLALHMHHDATGVFPSNGYGAAIESIPDVNGRPFMPSSTYFSSNGTFFTAFWAVGKPGQRPQAAFGSWAYSILPYLEQDAAYQTRDWRAGLRNYACPDRRASDPKPATDDLYGNYEGGGWLWARTDYAGNNRMIPLRSCRTLASVTDGTSQTILVGEKALAPEVYRSGSWYWDEPFFLGGAFGTRRGGDLLVPDSDGSPFADNWGSAHINGANFVFCDGSVRALEFQTSPAIVAMLLTPNGGEAVPDF